jgi:hypothetical protein
LFQNIFKTKGGRKMKQLKMMSVGAFILLLLFSSIVYGGDSTTKSLQIIQASPDYQITSIPAAPLSLISKPTSSSSIVLAWKDNSSTEDGFKIQRKEGACDSTNSWSQIATKEANVKTHTNSGLAPNTMYSYRVRAYNGEGNSAYSNCSSAKTALSGTSKAPTNLSATSISASQIKLIWTDNSTDEKSFKIYKKAGAGSWDLLATKGENIVSHTDDNASGNTTTTYSYYVQACNSSGCSPKTNTAVIPYKPINLSATAASSSKINLKWADKSSNETGFQIYRKSGVCSSTNPWSRIKTTGPNITSYSNTGLTLGKTYSYKIRAYTRSSAMPYAYSYSLYSNCSQATTPSDCVNIAGTWDVSDSGTITCVYDGYSETGPIGGDGSVTIKQNGCNISWTVSGVSGISEKREGTIHGNTLEVSGKFCVPLKPGVTFTKNQYTAEGIISGDEINGNGSGTCNGTYQGVNFTCTGKDTFVIMLSGLGTMDNKKAIGKQSLLFMNNVINIFPALSP